MDPLLAIAAALSAATAVAHSWLGLAVALVLLRAPGWRTGPGDLEIALQHPENATGMIPNYPPNQLVFAETLDENGRPEQARRAYKRAADLARKANSRTIPTRLNGTPRRRPRWPEFSDLVPADAVARPTSYRRLPIPLGFTREPRSTPSVAGPSGWRARCVTTSHTPCES
jgi:tetratricopeptide (TPR) repeat protein